MIPLFFYVLAFVAYARYFARRDPGAGRAATALLAAGALTHTFVIGMQTMEVGHVPFAGTTHAISTFVLLLALAYLYTEVTTDERGLGIFILPVIIVLQLLPAIGGLSPGRDVGPASASDAAVLQSPLFGAHVSAMLAAYASFGLAAVIGVTYVLQFKEIKAKHLDFFFTRLPSLQTLDVMNSRAVLIGWVLLTLGLVAGGLWWIEARATTPGDPRVQALSFADPKIFVALITWVVYAFELVARRAIGWRGRRSAILSTVGFAIVLINFVAVSYFLTESHNFGATNSLGKRDRVSSSRGASE